MLRTAGIMVEGERGAERVKEFLEKPRGQALNED
jgi:hypothetical protein